MKTFLRSGLLACALTGCHASMDEVPADGSAADMPEYADLFMPSEICDPVQERVARELANSLLP